jgi:hypothetical protein
MSALAGQLCPRKRIHAIIGAVIVTAMRSSSRAVASLSSSDRLIPAAARPGGRDAGTHHFACASLIAGGG